MWRCPVCRRPLSSAASAYYCRKGHSFDVARSGYVNLLLGHQQRSASPGDSPEMVRSRRQVLEEGLYEPLERVLGQLVVSCMVGLPGRSARLLDVGCGDGFFTDVIARQLGDQAHALEAYGIDVSRYAVDMAARRYRQIRFAVASVRELPVITGCVDSLWSIFAPRNEPEFARVLTKSGRLLAVRPGPGHLIELRRLLYAKLRPPGVRGFNRVLDSFQLLEERRLTFPVLLQNPGQAARLLAMTPYAWTARPMTRAAVQRLSGATVTADFLITAHGKPQ